MREKIRQAILETLYANEFSGKGETNLEIVRLVGVWEEAPFWQTVERIVQDALIQAGTHARYYRITSFGSIYAEDNKIAAIDLVNQNQEIRMATLDALAKVHAKEGSAGSTHYSTVSSYTSIDEQKLLDNLNLMRDVGYVDYGGGGTFRITREGLNAVKAWRLEQSPTGELERIEGLKQSERPGALQELLGVLIEAEGWRVDDVIKQAYNEKEVIYANEREYYHIRCTWDFDPVEAREVHQFHKQLVNRVGVRGLIFSMSGFSKGAVAGAMESAKGRVILFFGAKDIRSIIYSSKTFEALLGKKIQSLVKSGRIIFE